MFGKRRSQLIAGWDDERICSIRRPPRAPALTALEHNPFASGKTRERVRPPLFLLRPSDAVDAEQSVGRAPGRFWTPYYTLQPNTHRTSTAIAAVAEPLS